VSENSYPVETVLTLDIQNITIMATVAFNQFVNPWALDAIDWWYYVIYCGWLIFELVFIIFFIVETKGRTLEETAALFDGDEQTHDLTNMAGEAANMTMRMSRGVVLPTADSLSREDDKRDDSDYYEMKKRYRDSDITASSTDLNSRAI